MRFAGERSEKGKKLDWVFAKAAFIWFFSLVKWGWAGLAKLGAGDSGKWIGKYFELV